jgi:transcriptional/translational regulatory protein YebC/TACO1
MHIDVKRVLLVCIAICAGLTRALWHGGNNCIAFRASLRVYMGRASVVRAVTKAKSDDSKAKNNNHYAKKIIMAVKSGGNDPVSNRLLHQLLIEAKQANVPKEIIMRNIEKASTTSSNYKESVFEFYGHGTICFLVNVLTDNDNRAAKDVFLVAKNHGLKPATINSVAFKFTKKARLLVSPRVEDDQLLQLCVDEDVDNYELEERTQELVESSNWGSSSCIYVDIKDMAKLRDALRTKGYIVSTALANIPNEGFTSIASDAMEANLAAIADFEKLNDVDSIEHNMHIPDS